MLAMMAIRIPVMAATIYAEWRKGGDAPEAPISPQTRVSLTAGMVRSWALRYVMTIMSSMGMGVLLTVSPSRTGGCVMANTLSVTRSPSL